jgi:hypothetical protein
MCFAMPFGRAIRASFPERDRWPGRNRRPKGGRAAPPGSSALKPGMTILVGAAGPGLALHLTGFA